MTLRPLICHKQVIPGRTLNRPRCQSSLNPSKSRTGIGRGPTETHFANEHVEQLGQFVDAGAPEELTDWG